MTVEMPLDPPRRTAIERIAQRHPLMLTSSLSAFLEIAYASCPCGARAYHNLEHLAEMAALFTEVGRDIGWTKGNEAFAALLFHDAVYDPLAHGGQNEDRSAALFHRMAPLLPVLDGDRVAQLIRLTAKHGRLSRDEIDEEARLFLDCDMAILAAPRNRFNEYDVQISKEYSGVGALAFLEGRQAFFKRLASSERIFLSDYFHTRLESRARENVASYLEPLR